MFALLMTLTLAAPSQSAPTEHLNCPMCTGEIVQESTKANVRGNDLRGCCMPGEEPLKDQPGEHQNLGCSLKKAPNKSENPAPTMTTYLD